MSAFKLCKHVMMSCLILGIIVIMNICNILIEHYFGVENVVIHCVAILAVIAFVLTIFDGG